jgi:Bromodomain
MDTEQTIDAVGAQSEPSNDTETSHTDVDTTSKTTDIVPLEKSNDPTNHMDIDPVETPTAIENETVYSKAPDANSAIHADDSNNSHSTDIVGATPDVLERVLYRLTGGLPKCELHLIVQESNECEVALLEEIRVLEEALVAIAKDDDDTEMKVDTEVPTVDGSSNDSPATTSLHSILESQHLSPLDRFYTASALLGRLRDDMAVPSISSTTKDQNRTATTYTTTTTTTTTITSPAHESKVETALEGFMDPNSPFNGIYTRTIVDQESLLSLWKKISTNRAAFVFKRPVKSEEAPGYTDRIDFPMDLSLIRKRTITNNIQTFIDFHHALALISHNCVKYNGTTGK